MTARLAAWRGQGWLIGLLLALMLNQASSNMIRPMVSYRALASGVDPANLGLLSAVFSIAPLLFALRIGRLLDRGGELGVIAVGNVLMAACAVALAASDTPLPIFVLFGIHGLGHFAAAFATQPLLARFSHHGNYDQRFAAYSFSASIGHMLGPAASGLLAGDGSHEGVSRAILASAAVALVVVLPLAFIRPPVGSRPMPAWVPRARPAPVTAATAPPASVSAPASTPATAPSLLAILRMPDVARAILVSTAVLSSIDILIVYLPALGEDRSWPVSLVGGLLALRAGATMGTRLVLGALAARFGRRILLIVSMAVSAAALVALPFVEPIPLIVVLMIAAGAGLGIGQPLTMAWVAALSPARMRATVLSVRVMGNGLGQVVLPVVAGTVAIVGGAGGVLAATGLIVAASLGIGFWGRGGAGAPGADRDAAPEAARDGWSG